MIIVRFCSGLGNQLYQYAVYFYLKKKYPNAEIKADILSFDHVNVLNSGNGFSYGFGIDKYFGREIDYASYSEIKRISYEVQPSIFLINQFPKIAAKLAGDSKFAKIRGKIIPKYKRLKENYITNIPFDSYNGIIGHLDSTKNYYLNGLWQNYDYIRPIEKELRGVLQLEGVKSENARSLLKQIENCNSVCIHIRRGDFTSERYRYSHDLCAESYYKQAIENIKSRVENPQYFVFSDDIESSKKMLEGLENIFYVSGQENLSLQEEMMLISRCKSAIISNSTFSFWCVWLSDSQEKIVIAPKYSVRDENVWHRFSGPEHWTIIDNLSED